MHDYDCSDVIISANLLKIDISFHVNISMVDLKQLALKKGWSFNRSRTRVSIPLALPGFNFFV